MYDTDMYLNLFMSSKCFLHGSRSKSCCRISSNHGGSQIDWDSGGVHCRHSSTKRMQR